jgi:hypothetical protein
MRYTRDMVSLFGSKERSPNMEDVSSLPIAYKRALELFLFFGSEKMTYDVLRRQGVSNMDMPNISAIRKLCGIVDSVTTRPEPEIAELDQLFDEYLGGNVKSDQVSHRVAHQVQEIKNGHINNEAALVLLRPSPSSKKRFIGRDTLRGATHDCKISPRWTFPMTYSNRLEPSTVSLMRVVQQEVRPDLAANGLLNVDGSLARQIVPENTMPLFEIYQYDVLVKVYELILPPELVKETEKSYVVSRLEDRGFADVDKLITKPNLDPAFRFCFLDVIKIREKLFSNGLAGQIEEHYGRFMSTVNQLIRGDQPLPYGYSSVPN